jgi:hypothetical protein
MQLVNNHKMQIPKKFGPIGMVRQNTGVQHIGIAQDNARLLADSLALGLRRIPVINRRWH